MFPNRLDKRQYSLLFTLQQRVDFKRRSCHCMGNTKLSPHTLSRCPPSGTFGVLRKYFTVHLTRADCTRGLSPKLDSWMRSTDSLQKTSFQLTRDRRCAQEWHCFLHSYPSYFQQEVEWYIF